MKLSLKVNLFNFNFNLGKPSKLNFGTGSIFYKGGGFWKNFFLEQFQNFLGGGSSIFWNNFSSEKCHQFQLTLLDSSSVEEEQYGSDAKNCLRGCFGPV